MVVIEIITKDGKRLIEADELVYAGTSEPDEDGKVTATYHIINGREIELARSE